jgi:hypothetical protein
MATIIEHNAETQEITEIEVSPELLKKFAHDKIAYQQAEATKAADKAALLAKLGISESEAKLLLS